MNDVRFILEPYKGMSSRHTCPGCGKSREFTRYIDRERGGHLADYVGRCNREVNCGYHYTPKQYFAESQFNRQGAGFQQPRWNIQPQPKPEPASYISFGIFQKSLAEHRDNHFIRYLHNLFGADLTRELIERFYIGSSIHWQGATIFWQIDIKGKIRSGKIMLYSPDTGKRVKEPFNHIDWVHSVLKKRGVIQDFHLRQCLFGEHQLASPPMDKPVAIVESEKTAIIASVYLPELVWLACGSLTNLNAEKCGVLKGRRVVLFPDLNGFEKWREKAIQLQAQAGLNISVSDLLEKKASESDRAQGLDIADYLIRYDVPARAQKAEAGIAHSNSDLSEAGQELQATVAKRGVTVSENIGLCPHCQQPLLVLSHPDEDCVWVQCPTRPELQRNIQLSADEAATVTCSDCEAMPALITGRCPECIQRLLLCPNDPCSKCGGLRYWRYRASKGQPAGSYWRCGSCQPSDTRNVVWFEVAA